MCADACINMPILSSIFYLYMGIFCLDQRMSNDETNKLTIFKDDNEFEEFDREGK